MMGEVQQFVGSFSREATKFIAFLKRFDWSPMKTPLKSLWILRGVETQMLLFRKAVGLFHLLFLPFLLDNSF